VAKAVAQMRDMSAVNAALFVDMAVIAILWCVSAFIANPVGEFPIIDDWLYESVVKKLLTTGHYPQTEPATMTLVVNVLWGSLFCLPVGVSFTALRVSTLVASLLGLFGIYILIRDLQQSRWLGLVVTLTLAFSPAYYALSYSFMTDVPFTAIAVWAAVFFARSLRSESDFQILAGAALALAATLSRQIGLAIPIAFAVVLILRRGVAWRMMFRAGSPIILCLGGLIAFNYFLARTGRLPTTYNLFSNWMIATLTHARTLFTIPLSSMYSIVVNLGLFLLPIILCTMRGLFRFHGRDWIALTGAAITTMALGAAVRTHFGMSNLVPLPESNILVKSGIGLLWLRGADQVPSLPEAFWVLVTAMAFMGAILLIGEFSLYVPATLRRLLCRNPIGDTETVGMFLLLCGVIFVLPFLAIAPSDRYLVPCLPFFAAGMIGLFGKFPEATSRSERVPHIAAFALLVPFSLFTVTGTRDYLAWHRVSERASRDLMQSGHVSAEDIDGGNEFNASYPANPSRDDILKSVDEVARGDSMYVFRGELRKQLEAVVRSSWRPSSVKYLISFGPVQGYTVTKEYVYYNWMPPHVQKIMVLRKD
jgi:Dolichyl-phosphate-mannose-protein mannosyltransferase